MKNLTATLALVVLVGTCETLRAEGAFTQETAILAISREDQTEALKTKRLRKEFTLTETIRVLTTYRVVTRNHYIRYAHTLHFAEGAVTVKEHGNCQWQIEPNYAGVVTLPAGRRIYLLRPDLVDEVKLAPKK